MQLPVLVRRQYSVLPTASGRIAAASTWVLVSVRVNAWTAQRHAQLGAGIDRGSAWALEILAGAEEVPTVEDAAQPSRPDRWR